MRQLNGDSDGFTIIEVLVVIATISLLVTLAVPAIQSAREAARRAQCMNNLHQFGLAFGAFESQAGAFPAGVTVKVKGPLNGDSEWSVYDYFVELLPFLEANGINGQYHRDTWFCATQNQSAIQTPLSVASCPSTPRTDIVCENQFVPSQLVPSSISATEPFASICQTLDSRYSTTYLAAKSDYAVPAGAGTGLARRFGYTVASRSAIGLEGMFPWPIDDSASLLSKATLLMTSSSEVEFSRRLRIADVSDGTSHTFLMTEDAGRPEHWQSGTRSDASEPLHSAWADPFTVLTINGSTSQGRLCLLQCDNDGEIYSFHPGIVTFLFVDGHVEFVSVSADPAVILAWLTPSGGDRSP